MLALMLFGCSTPPIINDCQPDSALMQKSEPLKDIDTNKPLSEQDLIKDWLDDKTQYNTLKDKDNRLIDHVQKFCQNH